MSNYYDNNQLFAHIPENLFSVFTGPLKKLHADLLFLVYDLYRRSIYTLPKETIIDLFCEYLETAAIEDWPEENDAADERDIDRSIRGRANLLFRKLNEAGWLDQEQHPDYSYRVTLYDYAQALLDTLDKIRKGYRMEYRGRILSIYQNLTGEEGLSYVALQQAYEATTELIGGLRSLNHSIKKYTGELLEIKAPRDILSHIFDQYFSEVLGEQYYRLKTSEHISKYRTGIIMRVKQWQSNRPGIAAQAQLMVEEKQAAGKYQAENLIYDWLEYIEESFNSMDDILEEIDRRNVQYARAAVEKLRFQLRHGKGSEQSLRRALRYLSEEARRRGEREELDADIGRYIRLYPQRAIDELSIKTPPRQRREHIPRPLRITELTGETRQKKLERFRKRVQEEITVEEINRYVSELLEEQAELPLSAVPLYGREQWIRLIYILLYSRSRRANYILAGERGKTVALRRGSIEVPALILKRKEPRDAPL
ncbi:MAG TPA: DUF5716 family protein [Bacillota bacterium]|nr:DUF5716 family protein [Bacillota bacterium]HPZ11249.1 DUF5716 family protein [Bacillota bacterium]HQE09321.1 DUF5716 family protein [Bacillota bacterium]